MLGVPCLSATGWTVAPGLVDAHGTAPVLHEPLGLLALVAAAAALTGGQPLGA